MTDPVASDDRARPEEAWALAGRPLWARTGLVFVLALVLFAFLYAPSPLLYDNDSYYHLAVARSYLDEGLSAPFRWVRFGLLAEQFGDKELLFHLLLAPFAGWLDPGLGGRVALALLGATVLALIGHLSLRAIGPWGVVVPFWLCIGSLEFAWRLVRLRPELLAVVLLLLALWAAGRGRYRAVGLVAFAFTLSYTAFHAFLGIFLLLFLAHRRAAGRWAWGMVAYPVLGAAAALLVHPHFPDHLAVWWLQNVEFFRFRTLLDVGTEIRPNTTDVLLLANLGWFLGLGILWRGSVPRRPEGPPGVARAFGVGALAFGGLYLLMSRFAVYAVPLVTLWILFEIRRRGRTISARVRLPWRGELPAAAAWILCLLVSLPAAARELERLRLRNDPGPDAVRVVDRESLRAALPAGARVAAPWGTTPLLIFQAPHGRYLNVLDPVFLAVPEPAVHAAQERVFAGEEPDTPFVLAATLDSDHIAYSTATTPPPLTERLLADPRAELLYRGIHVLFRIRPPAGRPFVLDWRVVPPGGTVPPARAVSTDGWRRYPLAAAAGLRRLEGFVDARRVANARSCVAFTHDEEVAGDREIALEFAAAGPSTLWLDDRVVVRLPRGDGARLGRGPVFPLRLTAGDRRLTVLTCPGATGPGAGFYLVDRSKG